MNVSRQVVATFAGRGLRAVFALATLTIFIAVVGSSQFGTFVLFEGVLNAAAILANAGLGAAIQQRVGSGRGSGVPATAVAIKLPLFIITGVGLLAIAPMLNAYFGAALTVWLLPALGARELARVGVQTLRGEERVASATLFEAGGDLAFLIAGVGLATTGLGVRGLAAGFALGWTTVAAMTFYHTDTPVGRPTRNTACLLIEFAKFNAIASVLSGQLYSWVDTLVIGVFFSPDVVAAYEAAWRLSAGVLLLARAIGQVSFPQAAGLASEEKHDQIVALLPDALLGALVLIPPAVVGAIVLGDELLTLLAGEAAVIATAPMVILLVGRGFEAANEVIGRVLLGFDQPRAVAKAAAVFLVTNVVLNLVLVSTIGLIGAAVATSIAIAVNAALNAWSLSKTVTITVPWRGIVGASGAAIVMGLFVTGVARVIGPDSPVIVGALVCLGGMVFALALLGVPAYRQKGASLMQRIR